MTKDIFSAIAEPKRRKILGLLTNGQEWTVGAIAEAVNIPQPAASKHLNVLLEAGVVSAAKQGRYKRFRLQEEGLRPIFNWGKGFSTSA